MPYKQPAQVPKLRQGPYLLIQIVFVTFQSLDPPQYVFWYHDGKLINYDRVSRISIKTDPGEYECFKFIKVENVW